MTEENRGLTAAEKEVLGVAAEEGRFNARLLREETGFDETTVDEALRTLESAGTVRRLTEGLYEFVREPGTDGDQSDVARGIPEIPNEETQTAPIDPTMFEEGDGDEADEGATDETG